MIKKWSAPDMVYWKNSKARTGKRSAQ